ncbi:ABC transporter permease [Bradyrhizobium sp. DOA9]|uniref:ABC transporter permease n=1 Tax=Bradyrhizobium sp. DOA9 TaxID=1126627 RepID=UPI00046ACBF9|nr:ABC transporter permease [Bradyrhizobium sp. DOA9]
MPAWPLLIAPSIVLLLVFLVGPALGLIRASFFHGSTPFNGSGFSFEQYATFFLDSYYVGVLLETIGYGIVVALITLIIGFPVGYSLARLPPKQRRLRLLLVILPLTLSLVVVIFGWMVILGRSGLVNTIGLAIGIIDEPQRLLFNRGAVLVVLVQQFLPFMILSIMSVISQIDSTLEHAAANLRANRFTTFRRVIIPLALPGIANGLSLVFALTVSAFMTPRLIGGNRVQMLGSLIYEQIMIVLNWPFGSASAMVLLVLVLALLAVVNAYFAKKLIRKSKPNAT